MTGEVLAIIAAFAYGLAGVSIVRSKSAAKGDNGVFLSVATTAALSFVLWVGWGATVPTIILDTNGLYAFVVFGLAGLFSNVFGRQTMYRATELTGAVSAGLLRRLTPLFALPCGVIFLGERPGLLALLGGAFVLVGILTYIRPSPKGASQTSFEGISLGIFSSLSYALAYTFRSLGLDFVPDAALGTFIGALIGVIWILTVTLLRKGPFVGWRHVTIDSSFPYWRTALLLSIGQLLQFFALKTATIVSVAVLGTLEVLFSALFIILVTKCETIAFKKLLFASLLATMGTAFIFLN